MFSLMAVGVAAVLAQSYYTPDEAQALFHQSTEAYAQEDYSKARDGFEKLRVHGFGSPDVLYNLGTTYLAQGEIGRAIWAFKLARQGGGGGADLEANLDLARSRRSDQVVGGDMNRGILERLVVATDERILSWSFLISWVGLFTFLFLMRAGARTFTWRSGTLVALGATIAVPAGLLLLAHIHVRKTVREGVVLASSAQVRVLPKESAKISFEAHQGLEVRLLEPAEKFVKIHLPNDLEGWIAQSEIGEL